MAWCRGRGFPAPEGRSFEEDRGSGSSHDCASLAHHPGVLSSKRAGSSNAKNPPSSFDESIRSQSLLSLWPKSSLPTRDGNLPIVPVLVPLADLSTRQHSPWPTTMDIDSLGKKAGGSIHILLAADTSDIRAYKDSVLSASCWSQEPRKVLQTYRSHAHATRYLPKQ